LGSPPSESPTSAGGTVRNSERTSAVASAGGYTSHPFNEKLVALRDFDPPIDSFVGIPGLTWGWTASGGFRIPVIHDVKPRTTPPAVLLGFGFRGATFDDGWDIAGAYSTEGRRKELYFYGMVGFEYVFTPKRARLRSMTELSL